MTQKVQEPQRDQKSKQMIKQGTHSMTLATNRGKAKKILRIKKKNLQLQQNYIKKTKNKKKRT